MNHTRDIDQTPADTSVPAGTVFTFTDALRRISLVACAAAGIAMGGALMAMPAASTAGVEPYSAAGGAVQSAPKALVAESTPLGAPDSLYLELCLFGHQSGHKGCRAGSVYKDAEHAAAPVGRDIREHGYEYATNLGCGLAGVATGAATVNPAVGLGAGVGCGVLLQDDSAN